MLRRTRLFVQVGRMQRAQSRWNEQYSIFTRANSGRRVLTSLFSPSAAPSQSAITPPVVDTVLSSHPPPYNFSPFRVRLGQFRCLSAEVSSPSPSNSEIPGNISEADEPTPAVEEPVLKSSKTNKRKPKKRGRYKKNRERGIAREQAESFFEEMAPHVKFHDLKRLLANMDKKSLKESHERTRVARVHALLPSSKKRSSDKSSDSSAEPSWLETRVVKFLLGQSVDSCDTQKVERGAKKQTQAPSALNRRRLEKHVGIMRKAREIAVKHPLLWSLNQRRRLRIEHKHQMKSMRVEDYVMSDQDENNVLIPAEQWNNIDSYTADRASRLAALHESKSDETLQQEAKELVEHLADSLPVTYYESLIRVFSKYCKAEEEEVEQRQQFEKETTSESEKETSSDATSNSSKMKQLRRMRMLFSNMERCTKTHVHLVASELASFFYIDSPEQDEVSVTQNDPRLIQAQKAWNQAREQVMESLLKIDSQLLQSMPPSVTLKEETADTLEELEQLRTRPSDGVKIGRDRAQERGKDGRRRKHVHLIMDAIMLHDDWDSVPHVVKPPTDRMVFLENLPIDMQETELWDLYSRCGTIQSVQILNQREDLDPGKLTAKQRTELQKQTRQSHSARRKRWTRPTTPVYGIVTFASHEGFQQATMAPLRLFGMVIRRHPVRSLPASCMTKLYLEKIPPGLYSLDMEYKLSRLLHPDIYISLDMGHHDYAEPGSCEIKFPSFETAHHAYGIFKDQLDLEGTEVHWRRTPADAMKYWTRELGFD